MSPRLARAAALALALSLGATAPSCVSLDSFFFNPRRTDRYTLEYPADWPTERRVPAELRDVLTDIVASDGRTIVHAVFARQPADRMRTAPTVLYSHGNASNIDGYWTRVGILWSLGANVLIYDYPGYGRTEGTPSEAGVYMAARAANAWLRARTDIDQTRVYHYGFSLGSAAATELASTTRSRGLVLEAPFTSVMGLAADSSLLVPSSFVMSNRFDNRSKIADAARLAELGVLIFHGEADDFVQHRYGRELDEQIAADAPTRPHRLVTVPGANHGDVPERAGALYTDALRRFLEGTPAGR